MALLQILTEFGVVLSLRNREIVMHRVVNSPFSLLYRPYGHRKH